MYKEPWHDINDYTDAHRNALMDEITIEIAEQHCLYDRPITLLAKREDCDEVLVQSPESFFIVHLTWSNRKEQPPYLLTQTFDSLDAIVSRLNNDSLLF